MTFLIIGILAVVFLFLLFGQGFRASKRNVRRKFQNAELVRVLLNLDAEPLAELFRLYKEKFGPGPARYARHTYNKWKAGEVRPNKQTFNRFLVHLPRVMSFDLKCEVLRKLRAEYCKKEHHELDIHTDDWPGILIPFVNGMIERTYSTELPKPLKDRLKWLSEDEAEIANALLSESQAQESRNNLAFLEQEFANIERLLDNTTRNDKITHVLELPCGTVALNIKRK